MKFDRDVSQQDWKLCCRYVSVMKQKGFVLHEAWELELERWAANRERPSRKSTVTKLRLRIPFEP